MNRAALGFLVVAAAAIIPPLPSADASASSFPRTVAERKALMSSRPRAEIAEMVRALPQATLLDLGGAAVRELGAYSARMRKQERVGGKLLPAQVMTITVREQPQAVRMQVVDGPKKGRKVLYNEELRKGQFRVREAGILGIKALWLDLDSGLARRDTNHAVSDLGFGPILRHLGRDMKLAAPHGGHARADEGFDDRGRWCLTFTAPPAATKQIYAHKTRMCLDLVLGLPVQLEVHDAQGLLERVELTDVRREAALPPDFFTVEAAGL
jgi:hypothetical protein